MKQVIAAMALLSMTPVAAQAATLELICRGVRSFTTTTTSQVQTNIDNGWGGNRSATVTTRGRGEADGVIGIKLHDDTRGEIKLPRAMLPMWRSGSEDGWRPLSKLEVGAAQIKGQFKLNALNNPEFAVDRRTGAIELDGFGGGFNGVCEQAPDEGAPRKF